ncbi:primosomal protein N' [Rhabdochlamydiaceae symbiont of Dictyostelium giganteum]|uniref:replication restart helicase PriA n=1 Tax=Rhabdochlamydiaceae symbiont of Dictyostelium giganteum TaxID=3342349 RepID=UPI003850D374
MEEFKYVSIVLDLAVPKPLDYQIPEELYGEVHAGSRVIVPLRNKLSTGTVLELKKDSSFLKLSFIHALSQHQTRVPLDLLQLGIWISRYYSAPFSKVIKLLLPPSIRKEMQEKSQLFVKPLLSPQELLSYCVKLQGAKRRIIEILLKNAQGLFLSELLEKSGSSRSTLTSLEKEKIVSLNPLVIDRSLMSTWDFFPTKPKSLNDEQQAALTSIQASLLSRKFHTHLLFGVTGSGKTEVYLQAIEYALSLGLSVLFLVPEIALTSQTLERLRGRFQEKVAILHHRLSDGERRDSWQNIYLGKAPLVIGPRSALFSPVPNLGLIIVDEEHDGAYKQSDEMPCYQGRDVAVMRGKMRGATVILGSATPSLESYSNAALGKYHLNCLTQRADTASLPLIHVVDMKQEYQKASGFTLFSQKLLSSIKERLDLGEQTVLFLNRRGFHTLLTCLSCGNSVQCPSCSMSLTLHKESSSLACHLCNYTVQQMRSCPTCKAQDSFQFKGSGTEKIESTLKLLFPQARTLRLDADTTRHKGSHDKLFKQFRAGKADILIGTQMVAKGLHFPSVTLVGILNADASLHIPDFRASETVFQLVTQVSGRSGRGQLKGEVILQTNLPSHPLFEHAVKQDYEAFYQEEIKIRKTFKYPPFCHLIKLVFTGEDEKLTEKYAKHVRDQLSQKLPSSFEFLPITPCGYAKIKNQFRFQCLIKAEKIPLLSDLLSRIATSSSIRLLIDIDPLSTYF